MVKVLTVQGLIFILFCPAGLVLSWRLATAPDLATLVLVLATLLLSVEQARAATVDLQTIGQVAMAVEDPRLPAFRRLTWGVIGLELMGFYCAGLDLGWGVLMVLLSQLLFNGLATIALLPQSAVPVRDYGVRERLPVLGADGVGLVLAGCWALEIARLGCAIALLMIVLAYLILKYTSEVGHPASSE